MNTVKEDTQGTENTLKEDKEGTENTLQKDTTGTENTLQKDTTGTESTLKEDTVGTEGTVKEDTQATEGTVKEDTQGTEDTTKTLSCTRRWLKRHRRPLFSATSPFRKRRHRVVRQDCAWVATHGYSHLKKKILRSSNAIRSDAKKRHGGAGTAVRAGGLASK